MTKLVSISSHQSIATDLFVSRNNGNIFILSLLDYSSAINATSDTLPGIMRFHKVPHLPRFVGLERRTTASHRQTLRKLI